MDEKRYFVSETSGYHTIGQINQLLDFYSKIKIFYGIANNQSIFTTPFHLAE
jgi:hypothetical protein